MVSLELFGRHNPEAGGFSLSTCIGIRWASRFGSLYDSDCVGEYAADVGGVCHGVQGEDGRLLAGEEGDLQRTAGFVGCHPFGLFAAAEGVFVEEDFCGGHGEAVEASGSGDGGIGVEGSAELGFFEGADAGHGEAGEIDGELAVGEDDVAGDGAGVGTCGAPIAVLLGEEGEGGEEDGGGDDGAGSDSHAVSIEAWGAETVSDGRLVR